LARQSHLLPLRTSRGRCAPAPSLDVPVEQAALGMIVVQRSRAPSLSSDARTISPSFAVPFLRGYTFKAGSYIYVNSPTISRSEWHPFSIIQVPGKTPKAAFYAEAVSHPPFPGCCVRCIRQREGGERERENSFNKLVLRMAFRQPGAGGVPGRQ